MKHGKLLKNAVILTATSLILRTVGMGFRVWMTNAIGAGGIGLYQLLISVYVFASAFATSGICTAVTRLTAEFSARRESESKIMRRAIELTMLLSVITILLLVLFSEYIAEYIIDDPKAATAVKVLGLGIPFMGLCSCFRGYFIAKRKTISSSISQLIEQAVRICAVMLLVSANIEKGLEYSVAAILLGDGIAEASGCLFMYIVYRRESGKIKNFDPGPPVIKKMIHIAFPITAGRYTHTALRTVENLIVPQMLALYIADKTRAIEQFGMIKGMAIPLLFFPASFLTAFSTLLIPEISEAMARRQSYKLRLATERAIGITIIISVLISGVFYLCSGEISSLLYPEENIAPLISSLAPLVPFMYLECVCDGILKGLDQQKHSFLYLVFDSVSRIALILLILPSSGMKGFIWIMIYSNLLTSLLNIRRLLKVTKTPVKIGSWILKPAISIVIALGVASALRSSVSGDILKLAVGFFVCSAVYILTMFFWGELKIANDIL